MADFQRLGATSGIQIAADIANQSLQLFEIQIGKWIGTEYDTVLFLQKPVFKAFGQKRIKPWRFLRMFLA